MQLVSSSVAGISGVTTNLGQISLPFSTTPALYVDVDTVLTGGGSVVGASPATMFTGANGTRLVNADNLIHGTGVVAFQVPVTNRGIIEADVPSNTDLQLSSTLLGSATNINSGMLKASGGGHLRIASNPLQNFEGATSGKIIAGQNSVVELMSTTINGGIVQFEGSDPVTQGKLQVESAVSMQDVTIQGAMRSTTSTAITMTGQINNQGTIAVPLNVTTSLQLNGPGEVLLQNSWLTYSTNARIINQSNLLHGPSATWGTGPVTFINRGTLRSDGTLSLSNSSMKFTNSGRLEAGPGATLNVGSFELTNYEGATGGTVFAADGGVVNLGVVHGGTLSTSGTGVIKVSAVGSAINLDNIRNTGNLETTNARITGAITNDGLMKGSIVPITLVQFNGTGTWEATSIQPFFSNWSRIVNGPQHTILGNGSLNALVTLENHGTLTVKAASTLNYAGILDNFGLVEAPAGTSLNITSENFQLDNRGMMRFNGTSQIVAGDWRNRAGGVIEINGSVALQDSSQGAATTLHNEIGALLKGGGSLTRIASSETTLVNAGTIEPGDGIKTLAIAGNFQQLATGRLKIDLDVGNLPASDLLAINGAASLAGALELTLSPGDVPTLGNSFTLLTANDGITGAFEQLLLPAVGSGLFWHVQYSASDVRAIVTELIPGDFNRDAVVDVGDYIVWRKSLGSTTALAADADGSSVVDQADYDLWSAHFGQIASTGNGRGSLAATVPEPATAGLFASMLLALAFAPSRRSRRTS
jgi:hypothetical protein